MSELPEGWAECQLQDILEPQRGIFDGPFGSSLKTADYVNEGARVVRLENLATFNFIHSKETWISLEKFNSLRKHEVRAGDLIVGSFVDDSVRTCIVPELDTPAVVKADCFCVRSRDAVINRQFLMYQLGLASTRDALVGEVHGATRPRITTKQLRAVPLRLPPLAEQHRIVATIEDLVGRLRRIQSKLLSIQTRVYSVTHSAYSAAFKGMNYDSTPLGALLREPLRNGHSARMTTSTKGVRAITLTAVTNGDFSERNTKLTAADPDRVAHLFLSDGDILIERSNTPELVGTARRYVGPPNFAIFPDLCIRVRAKDEVDSEYLEAYLQTPAVRRYFRDEAQGTSGSMPKINQETIQRLEIPLPPLPVQQKIVGDLRKQTDAAAAAGARIERAMKIMQGVESAVLAKAFAGELVPTEADLARREGRTYEPAPILLERIRGTAGPIPVDRRPR